jgi:hypothetical protein
LHESLGDIPPVEFEQLHAARGPISDNGSVTDPSPRAADGLTRSPILPVGALERSNGTDRAFPASPATIAAALSAVHDPPAAQRAARRSHYAPMGAAKNPLKTVSVEPGPARAVLRVWQQPGV